MSASAAVKVVDPFNDAARHSRIPCCSANFLKAMSIS
jgi:hypothetical protein